MRPTHSYRDYSFYWGQPAWYYHTPFHPVYYFQPPQMVGGVMHPGGLRWGSILLGLLVWGALIGGGIYLVRRLLSR